MLLVVVVLLLAVIAFRLHPVPAYAAKKFTYRVVPVQQGTADQNVAKEVEKETQAGWELVAAPMWRVDAINQPEGFLILRK